MKILLNWLKEFVDIKSKPEKLVHDLSLFGHEAEEINKIGNDYLIDFEITANRGDCLSHLGIAREVSALYQTKIKNNMTDEFPAEIEIKAPPSIKIEKDNLCARYTGVVIKDFKVADSPKWLQERLLEIGVRPINNIVDITNYVMFELGQPLHAFDLDKINNHKFNIRFSKSNEIITTLDGIKRKLNNKTIVIDDGDKIFDLAGIMGGANAEISKKTSTIFLEAAIFDAKLVRFSSKFLNLKTEASYRYERGVDIGGTIFALLRSLNLINKVCPAAKAGKITDFINYKFKEKSIAVNDNKINHLLGTNYSHLEIVNYLSRLNFIYNKNEVIIPSYRYKDINIWNDITQEIARLDKFEHIKPAKISLLTNKPDSISIKINSLRQYLFENGFTEVYSYSFADEKILELLGYNIKNLRKVLNGISPETKYLRPNLDISLLSAATKNPWAPEIRIFEIAKVFLQNKEIWQIGIVSDAKKTKQLKEIISKIDRNYEIKEPSQEILNKLKIRKKLHYIILNLSNTNSNNTIYKYKKQFSLYHEISEYPPTIRDFAFIVDKHFDSDKIKNDIYKVSKKIFIVELFDEFISDKFGKNKKNIAFHVWIQDLSMPMSENDVNNIAFKIIKDIENKYKAKHRS